MGREGGGGGGDHIRWAPMVMEPNVAKRGKKKKREGGREEAACLAATETAGTPTYHGSGPWFWSPAPTGEQREKAFLSATEPAAGAFQKESSRHSHNRWGRLREDG